jgi:hypothetical protein
MFEWRGGTLWADDEATRERFDVGPIENLLGLPPELLERLEALSVWHDTALDWDNPGGPSLWSDAEWARFREAAEAIRADVERALGPATQVRYVGL